MGAMGKNGQRGCTRWMVWEGTRLGKPGADGVIRSWRSLMEALDLAERALEAGDYSKRARRVKLRRVRGWAGGIRVWVRLGGRRNWVWGGV